MCASGSNFVWDSELSACRNCGKEFVVTKKESGNISYETTCSYDCSHCECSLSVSLTHKLSLSLAHTHTRTLMHTLDYWSFVGMPHPGLESTLKGKDRVRAATQTALLMSFQILECESYYKTMLWCRQIDCFTQRIIWCVLKSTHPCKKTRTPFHRHTHWLQMSFLFYYRILLLWTWWHWQLTRKATSCIGPNRTR